MDYMIQLDTSNDIEESTRTSTEEASDVSDSNERICDSDTHLIQFEEKNQIHNKNREFFTLLKELPNDIKRYIIFILMGYAIPCGFQFSRTFEGFFSTYVPLEFSPDGKSILLTSHPKN